MAFGKFLFVNFGFLFLIFYIVIAKEIKKIKQQWPLYRCNPSYMLLADNIVENYNYCLSQTSKVSFGNLAPKISALQDSGFKSQFDSNSNSVNHVKSHNKFAASTNLSLSDILEKSGKISTIGTIFVGQFKGILSNLSDIVTSLSGTMTAGVSGLGVLNNKFASITDYINQL